MAKGLKPKPYVIYHGGGCPDGFAAATVAHMAFGDEAHYVGISPSSPLPKMRAGADVFFLDIAPRREDLKRLATTQGKVYVLDHHRSSQTALEGEWPKNVHITFDMNRSGAVLTWQHFWCGEVPQGLLYVEDRDLWRHELPNGDEYAMALASYPRDFDVWRSLLIGDVSQQHKLITEGTALVRQKEQWVDLLLERSVRTAMLGVKYVFPAVNTNHFLASDTGHALLKKFPDAPFSGIYRDVEDGTREWSFRSEDSRVDVGTLAGTIAGGGGHRNAAGATEAHAQQHIFLLNYRYGKE